MSVHAVGNVAKATVAGNAPPGRAWRLSSNPCDGRGEATSFRRGQQRDRLRTATTGVGSLPTEHTGLDNESVTSG